jgi:hypothetical protein
MAISSPAYAQESAPNMPDTHHSSTLPEEHTTDSAHSKSSLETADTAVNTDADPLEVEFVGDVKTDDKLPTLETLKKIENLSVLDQDGKAIPFKNLYTGPNVAKRVLIIFIRHFFCGVRIAPLSSILCPNMHIRTARNTYEHSPPPSQLPPSSPFRHQHSSP